MKSITFSPVNSAIQISKETALQLGIDLNVDQQHGDLKTVGVWNIPVSYKAIAISAIYGKKEGSFFNECLEKTVYGVRTMSNIRQGGYELEGYVSIGGKKYSSFTSSQLFEIDGKLIDVAVIHARVKN